MQGQGSVLLFQPRTVTPSERLFAAAHRERLNRMAAAAHKDPAEARKQAIPFRQKCDAVPEAVIDEPETVEQWAERQLKLHGPLKKPWFSIVGEVGEVAEEPREPRQPSIIDIQFEVAKFYDVRRADIVSKRRTKDVVRPRQVAMYLAKMLTGRSFPDIGRRFGGRDHTTALHAVKKIDHLRERDALLDEDLNALCSLLARATIAADPVPVE